MPAPDLNTLPRGNTCHGVNRAIFEHLLASGRDLSASSILDVPCGAGAFVKILKTTFPKARVVGADRELPRDATSGNFTVVDASRPFSIGGPHFDVICCISGVMEFDNTLQFFASCRTQLKDDGIFIVTNDTVATARDRLTFLATGRTRRFGLFTAAHRPTWKSISIQNLLRIAHDAGFVMRSVRYVPVRPKDWLMLPFALLLWPGQWLYLRLADDAAPFHERRALHPFLSLLSRHYVIVLAPRPADPSSR